MNQARHRREIRQLGTARRDRRSLLVTTALQAACLVVVALPAAAQPAPSARPTGGTVVGGAAAISQTASNTQIRQSTQRGAINWQSFDVGSQQSVTFQQPNATSTTLNRVVGPDPSQIAGRITANGQIVISNQSGVLFYKGAQVDTAGLVATSANITNENFMSGKMVFDQAGKPNAAVVNEGTLTARQAGLVGLVAPRVANSGVIDAKLGHVVLAGAPTATLDMYGDGMLSIDVTDKVRQVPLGRDGKPATALVTNSGTIIAEGGTVRLTAAAADGLVQTLVNAGGKITAAGGRVEIAGTGGSVQVDGDVLVNGRGPAGIGGQIAVNATEGVTIARGARLSANGAAGGGTVAIGTTLARAAGGPSVASASTAKTVSVQQGATIRADATRRGHGGNVVLLSTDHTEHAGSITARGGKQGGDGGTVEISGATIGLTGGADVSAPHGAMGTILLDPVDLVIGPQGGGAPVAVGATDPNVGFSATPGTGTVTPASLQALTGNVHVEATNNITVNASVTLSHPNQNFTLEAGNNITVNAGLDVTGTLKLIAASSNSPAPVASGSVTIGPQGVLTAGGDINLIGGTGTLSFGGFATAGSNGTITLVGDLMAFPNGDGGSGLTAGSLVIAPATANRPIELIASGTANPNALSLPYYTLSNIASVATLDLGVPSATPSAGAINLGNPGDFIDLRFINYVGQPENLPLVPPNHAPGYGPTTLGLYSAGAVTQGGSLAVGTVQGTAASVALTALPLTGGEGVSGNQIDALGAFNTTAGSFALYDNVPLTVTGTVSVPSGPAFTGRVLTLADDSIAIAPAGTLGVGGFLLASGGAVQLAPLTSGTGIEVIASGTATPGVLSLTTTELARMQDFDLFLGLQPGSPVSTGDIRLGNAGDNINLAPANVLVFYSTGSVTQNGSLTVPIISGDASLVRLTNPNNSIQTVGDVTAPQGFALASATDLQVVNTINAATGGIALSSGGNLTLGVLTNASVLNGGTSAFGTGISLSATGAIIQSPNSVLNTDHLNATGGSVALTGTANAVSSLLQSSTTAGDFALTDGVPLTVGGTLTVPSTHNIALTADSIAINNGPQGFGTPSLSAPNGSVILAPLTANRPVELIASPTAANAGALSLTTAEIADVHAGSLQLGSATSGSIKLGNPGDVLNISGSVGALVLQTGTLGDVTEGGTLTVGTLSGQTRNAALTGGNTIAILGVFSVSNGFTLADGSRLTVSGPVTDTGTTSQTTISAAGTLGLAGNVSSSTRVQLTASNGDITQSGGTISAPAVALVATGAITQTGTAGAITAAGTLTGSAGGTVSLQNTANLIGTLGSFSSTGGFALTDGQALTQAGPLTDTVSIALKTQAGNLTLGGTLAAPSVTVIAADNVVQGGGAIVTTTGALVAIASTGSVDLTSALNAVPRLGSGGSAGAFNFTDSSPTLAVIGTVTAGSPTTPSSITLTDDAPSFGPQGALVAQGGVVTLQPFAATTFTVGGGGGITGAPPVTAQTLVIGSDTAQTVTLAGAFNLATVNALNLVSNDVVTESGAGAVNIGTLSAQGRTITLGGANTVGTLANAYYQPVTGPVAAADTLSLTNSGNLAITGLVSARNATLTDPTGVITSTGTLSVGTLNGQALAVQLGGGNNAVGTLGTFATTGGFTLADTSALTVTGPVAGNGITLSSAGTLAIPGIVNAGTATLSLATPLALTETGTIAASTLTASASVATLSGASGTANRVNTLGTVSTTGGFTFVDGTPLTVTGPVTDSSAIAISSLGSLALAGGITAPTVTLTAADAGAGSNIVQTAGTVAGATAIVLNAPVGSITQTGGALTGGALSGLAGGTVSLGSATNSVSGLGAFTSVGGFTLTDGLAAGGTLTQTGPLSDNAGPITLDARAGSLVLTGALSAPSVVLNANAGISQSGGGISANTLAASSTLGPVLLGQTANAVGTLQGSTAAGAFSLTDAVPLTIGGTILATGPTPTITLADDAPSFGPQGLLVASGGTVALGPYTPNALFTVGGGGVIGGASNVIANTLLVGSGIAGTVLVTGPIDLTGVSALDLVSGGAVGETGTGAISVGTLNASGTAITLTGANTIAALGTIATPGIFSFADTGFALTGTVSAGGANLVSSGAITETGTLLAAALSGSSAGDASFTGTNRVGTLGNFQTGTGNASGAFTLLDGQSLTITGAVVASGSNTVVAGGTAGTGGDLVIAGTGSVSAPIDTLIAHGGTLAAGNITIGGLVSTGTILPGNQVTLTADGAVSNPGGTLLAGTLTGSAGSVTLTQAVSVGTLGAFTSAGNFTLADATPLVIGGTVQAGGTLPLLSIADGQPSFGPGGALIARQGTVTLAPYAAGGTLAIGSGTTLGLAPAVIADTFVVGAADSGAVTVAGTLNVTGAATLDLVSGAAVAELPGAVIAANALAGSAATTFTLPGANAIATLGDITAPGGLQVRDASPVTLAGTLSGASVAITADTVAFGPAALLNAGTSGIVALGAFTSGGTQTISANTLGGPAQTVAGTVDLGGDAASVVVTGSLNFGTATVAFTASGPVVETGSGSIAAGVLQGSVGSLDFGGANSIATLGALTSENGVNLVDTVPLTVSGPVVDGAFVRLGISGSLTLAGNLAAPVATLVATDAIGQTTGTIAVGTLNGSADSASFTQANSIATLGSFTTVGNLILNDVQSLDIAGPVGAGALALTTTGSITQSGSIVAAALDVNAGGIVTLTGSNTIGVLAGANSVGGFSLADTGPLVVRGNATDTTAIALNATGSLVLAGTLNAPSVNLVAGGAITELAQEADAGPDAGLIVTSLLTGSGAGVGLGQANQVAALGTFASSGDFLLADASALTIQGRVAAGAGNTLTIASDATAFGAGGTLTATGGVVALAPYTTGGTLSVGGGTALGGSPAVNAGTLVLGSSDTGTLVVSGALNVTGVATVDLVSGGPVIETGSGAIAAGVLIGSAGNGVSLTGANQIGTLGAVSSGGGGNIQIYDTAPITVAGTISAPNAQIQIRDDAITVAPGALLDVGNAVVSLTGGFPNAVFLSPYASTDPLTLSGGNGAAGAPVTVTPLVSIGSFVLANTGTVLAGSVTIDGGLNFGAAAVRLTATNGVLERGAGAIGAGTLISGGVNGLIDFGGSGSVSLTGGNAIVNVSTYTSGTGFTLNNTQSLAVIGPIRDDNAINLTVAGSIALGATLQAPSVSLVSTGALTQTAGTIVADTLTGSVGRQGAAANVALTQSNSIGALGSFASFGTFSLTDAVPLTVGGTVSASGPGSSLGILDNAIVFGAGALVSSDGVVSLQPLANAGGFTLGGGSGTGGASLVGGSALVLGAAGVPTTITGALNLTGVPSVTLNGAPITETGTGALAASVLNLAAPASSVDLGGANQVGTLASAPGLTSFSMFDTGDLTLSGSISAGTANLTSGGRIVQTTGTFAVGTLSGSAVGLAQFGPDAAGPVAQVGTLGAFAVTNAGTLALADSTPLTIAGPLSASQIAISAPASITLQATTISTDGSPQTGAQPSGPGSYFAVTAGTGQNAAPGQFTQVGSASIAGLTGSASTLRIQVPDGGAITLQDLTGPATNLVLGTGAGGRASGSIAVGSLLVVGQGGAATLTGTVANQTGSLAAQGSFIMPTRDVNYQLNGCEIASVTCNLPPPPPPPPPPFQSVGLTSSGSTTQQESQGEPLVYQTVPEYLDPSLTAELAPKSFLPNVYLITLNLLTLAIAPDPNDPDLLLPNISAQDY